MISNHLKSRLISIGKKQNVYSNYFEKIVEIFSNKLSDIALIEWTGKPNQFMFLNHEVEFIIMWEDKWWDKEVIQVKIEIERALNEKEKEKKTDSEKAFDIKAPVFFDVDSLSNVRIGNKTYSMDEEELIEELLIKICASLGLLITH